MNANQVLETSWQLLAKADKMLEQFRKACRQSELLRREIHNIRARCERAHQNGHTHSLFQQQMRLLILQGVVGMYVHYMKRKAECIHMVSMEARDVYNPADGELIEGRDDCPVSQIPELNLITNDIGGAEISHKTE